MSCESFTIIFGPKTKKKKQKVYLNTDIRLDGAVRFNAIQDLFAWEFLAFVEDRKTLITVIGYNNCESNSARKSAYNFANIYVWKTFL